VRARREILRKDEPLERLSLGLKRWKRKEVSFGDERETKESNLKIEANLVYRDSPRKDERNLKVGREVEVS